MVEREVPLFETVEEESDFWDTQDVTTFDAIEVSLEDVMDEGPQGQHEILHVDLPRELSHRLWSAAEARGLPCDRFVVEVLDRATRGAK